MWSSATPTASLASVRRSSASASRAYRPCCSARRIWLSRCVRALTSDARCSSCAVRSMRRAEAVASWSCIFCSAMSAACVRATSLRLSSAAFCCANSASRVSSFCWRSSIREVSVENICKDTGSSVPDSSERSDRSCWFSRRSASTVTAS